MVFNSLNLLKKRFILNVNQVCLIDTFILYLMYSVPLDFSRLYRSNISETVSTINFLSYSKSNNFRRIKYVIVHKTTYKPKKQCGNTHTEHQTYIHARNRSYFGIVNLHNGTTKSQRCRNSAALISNYNNNNKGVQQTTH